MFKTLIASAAIAACFAMPAHATTIINGDFEDTAPVNPFDTVAGGNTTTINGWRVGGTSVDFIGSYWQAQSGRNSIDLAGTPGLGSIAQDIATAIGQTYRVTFWVSRNPDGGINPRTGLVDVGGTQTVFSFANAASTLANMGWEKRTYDFTALNALTTLRFSADPATSGRDFGMALDNISLASAPEPATWAMMIMGFGLIGGALRNRKALTARFAAA